MRSIGDVRDDFVKLNEIWYERHKIYRKIFDGTETILRSVLSKFLFYGDNIHHYQEAKK